MIDNKLLSISNLDLPIYRVMHFDYVYDLFKTGMLVMTRPHKWDDPFENCLLKLKAYTKSTGEEISIRGVIDIFFGLCWSLDSKESDATWRIYSPHKKGVRITTTVRKLISSLLHHENPEKANLFYVGKVRYMDADKIIDVITGAITNKRLLKTYNGKALAKLLLLKRKEFSHEKEVRLLFSDPGQTIKQYEPQCSFRINPFDLIDEIVFDPRIMDIHFELYRDELRYLGVKAQIYQSQLYQVPSGRIELDD